jgi:hypothetical protein
MLITLLDLLSKEDEETEIRMDCLASLVSDSVDTTIQIQ